MSIDERIGRRSFIHALGAAGFAAMFPNAFSDYAVAAEPVTEAIRRGGGELAFAYGTEPDKVATFRKRYPDVKWASSEDEVLNDNSIQLVLSSKIANERAALGVSAMQHGKDFLSDKPGITTTEDLALVRKTIAETKRIYGILYSERLEVPAAVKAGELVKAGAIGKVIQTINIAPHQVVQRAGDA